MDDILPPTELVAPTLRARLELLTEREAKIAAEIRELRMILGDGAKVRRTPSGRRSRYDVPECGTESAYQRHRHYGQPQDDACRAAHAAHNRVGVAS